MAAFDAVALQLQGTPNRRRPATQVVLEHVIGGTAFQSLDGQLLADGSGDEHQWGIRRMFADDGQGGLPAETRHREITQDDVWYELAQRLAQSGFAVDTGMLERLRKFVAQF